MTSPDVPIRTARLVLRRARPEDLHDLHAVLGDPLAMRFWSTPPHGDIAETRVWLDSMISAPPDASDDFVIERAGRVIGKAGCWRVPEIGFILRSDHWRQGYAREALAALIPHLFARFDVPALTADVDPRNAACLALLKGLGFIETGRAARTWLVGYEYCDSVYLALARPQDSLPMQGGEGAERRKSGLRLPPARG